MDAAELGRYLSDAREERELSLKTVAREIHIRKEILVAIERGEVLGLPVAPQQLRGMLRNYARYLRLNPGQVLAWFDTAYRNTEEGASPISSPIDEDASPLVNQRRSATAKVRKSFNFWRTLMLSILLLLFIVLVLLLFWVLASLNLRVTPMPTPVFGLRTEPTPIVSTAPQLFIAPSPSGEAPSEVGQVNFEGIQLQITLEQRGWLRVIVDDDERLARLARVGENFNYTAESEIRLEAANAASLKIQFMGETLQDLGRRGQSLLLVFTDEGMASELGSYTEQSLLEEIPVDDATQETTAPNGNALMSLENAPSPMATVAPAMRSTIVATPTSAPPIPTQTPVLPPRTPVGLPPTKEA